MVDLILNQGYLTPAVEFQDPIYAMALCGEIFEEASNPTSLDKGFVRGPVIAEAAQALENLMEQRVYEIYSSNPSAVWKTSIKCADILAGDLHNIFLTVGNWHIRSITPREHVSGFVFDAEDLLDKGAELRGIDFLSNYTKIIYEFLTDPSGEKSAEALRTELERVQKTRSLYGENAKEHIRSLERYYYAYPEIVYPGRLPVDWAVEIWKDGVQVWIAQEELYRSKVLPMPSFWYD